jgi:hypothetical protein
VISINMPLIPQHFRRFKKKNFKDPGPLSFKKRFRAAYSKIVARDVRTFSDTPVKLALRHQIRMLKCPVSSLCV